MCPVSVLRLRCRSILFELNSDYGEMPVNRLAEEWVVTKKSA